MEDLQAMTLPYYPEVGVDLHLFLSWWDFDEDFTPANHQAPQGSPLRQGITLNILIEKAIITQAQSLLQKVSDLEAIRSNIYHDEDCKLLPYFRCSPLAGMSLHRRSFMWAC